MTRVQKFKIGTEFRYSKPYDPQKPKTIDGCPNYLYYTDTPGQNMPLLESGINAIAKTKAPDGLRIPAINLRSSHHKSGSSETPWQDFHDPDNGSAIYFGDNKVTNKKRPEEITGNKALLEQLILHNSSKRSDRMFAAPVLCWDFSKKGFGKFNGYGIITKAELVTQIDQKTKSPFTNYRFELALFSLTEENEEFDWQWISDRRNKKLSAENTLEHAPKAWKEWVKNGEVCIEKCRRKTYKMLVVKSEDQILKPSSKEGKILQTIVDYYPKTKEERFEALASFATEQLFKETKVKYSPQWINPKGADGGVDFVGRLELGRDLLAGTKVVVLGQAKCKKPNNATNGSDIARLVARLQRGWIGVFVTTSYYSDAVQKEVLADRYPVVLINGKKLEEIISTYMHKTGEEKIENFLKKIDATYEEMISRQRPEELLYK